MPSSLKKYVLIFLLLCACSKIQAQPPELKFRHLDIPDGLPSDQISAIVKDKAGYMWIATNEGLCRYDGTSIVVFRNTLSDTNTLPDNFITSLVISKDDRLFIGTSKGVYEYNYKANKFTRLTEPGEKKPGERLRKIFLLDSKNNLWIFESGLPLLVYNIVSHKTRQLDFYLNEKQLKLYSIYEGSNDHYWISCTDKFFNYDFDNNTSQTFSNPYQSAGKPNSITSFYEAPDHSLWCTTLSTGLVHFDPVSKSSSKFLYDKTIADNLSDCLKFLPDTKTGKPILWLATPWALCSFDTITKKYTAYKQDVYNSFSCRINFTQRYFLGLYYDAAQHVLWYYGPNGIDICSFDEQNIQSFYSITEQEKQPFSEVRAFIQNKASPGEYLIGCANSKSIFIYNEKERSLSSKVLPLNENGINALLQLSDDKIWLANGNAVYEWIPSGNKLKDISTYFTDSKCDCKSTKLCLFKDSHGMIWMGTKGQGLCRYDMASGKAIWFNQYQHDSTQLKMNFVPAVTEVNGAIYAVEYTNGIYKFDSAGKLQQHFIADKVNNHSITTGIRSYFDIVSGRENNLWITTYQGLLQFDILKQSFSLFNEQDELPYGASNKAAEDGRGIIWADYRSFLIAFDPLVKKVRVFNYRNGYNGAQDGSCLLINDKGNIRIAYSNRIDAVDDDPFKEANIVLPKMLITSVQAGETTFQLLDTAGELKRLHIYHKDNEFSIHFALPLFSNLDGFVYYYKLEGYDKEWINTGKESFAKYANLPGGNYTFLVKAINTITGQSTAVTGLPITVHPPYYRTWWFILLCIVLITVLLYSFYKYRLRQLFKLEKMRSSISSDLHDEVGATLSSISIYSNVAQKLSDKDMETTKEYLSRIEYSSREMIEKMGDIVWSINPVNDTIDKVISRMHSYAYEMLGAKNIKVNWQQQPEIVQQKLSMEQRKNLYLFFKEAVNNIAKYAEATTVNIALSRNEKEINLIIKDNGAGFDTAVEYTGNGLKNLQLRAAQLKGKYIINAAPGTGTSVSLLFPL
jgi:ligand-binding sensor domain-containing protein/two-component sensor histidine kinase